VPGTADGKIIAGQRIDRLALGMSTADVFKVFGEPTESVRLSNTYVWGPIGAAFRGDPEFAWRVLTNSPSHTTPEGLHVGSSEFEMKAKLGQPMKIMDDSLRDADHQVVKTNYGYCYATGIELWFFASSEVTSIAVLPPGQCSE
jgi:hypothetical protein